MKLRNNQKIQTIYITDTLTRKKRVFKPLIPNKVGIYSCGPTVYDFPHIGNMRAYVFADVLKSMFIYNGYEVFHVINITDVGHLTSDMDEGDDKMELSAKKSSKSAYELADFYTQEFLTSMQLLNIARPSVFCKASDHIQDQIALIQKLDQKNYTYTTSDGVYFDSSKVKNYSELAQLDTQGNLAGARVEKNPEKRNASDFALWKFSPQGSTRQMEWQSPWGIGFPGWHIECSAMSMKYLGESFDLHTGGIDHIPVHHTNEIAQSEAATNKKFVNYWLHCAFLEVESQKMAKSLGNIYTIKQLIEKGYDPLSFRYLLLTSHYRTKMNFTWQALDSAQTAINSIRKTLAAYQGDSESSPDSGFTTKFRQKLNDDLNTAECLALLWEVLKSDLAPSTKKATVLNFDSVLKLDLGKYQTNEIALSILPENIQALISKRNEYRAMKKWSEADQVRQELLNLGILLEDTATGIVIKKT